MDRIHKTRRIQRCFDLSATPFAPTGKANTEAGLFEWIVSDFGLNDAIEGGLVKTLDDWKKAGHTSPSVMLTVCNRTETSARVEHYFRNGDAHWPELHAPARTLRLPCCRSAGTPRT